MLTSTIISTTTTSTMSSVSSVGIPEYGMLTVTALILLLSAREILLASAKWSESLDCSLKMTIIPLVVVFVAIVVFRLSEII
ncbi:hypothetical protein [Methanomethylovorans sp.]|uniref:hypothetical protein n=1 Tax=Methanomethylovorans sp. TaxID=2758717 RepID=UPI00351C3BE6